jgi:spermidine synthase
MAPLALLSLAGYSQLPLFAFPQFEISMKRFVLLDTAPIPENGGALCLFEYGEDFVIKIQGGDGGQLMNTRMHGSEDALAEIPCRKVAGRPDSRVLIGGLGMGFTLRAALAVLPPDAQVEVAELVAAVVRWAKGPLAGLFAGGLEDPRTRVIETDVSRLITKARGAYDAILLDVDNGPDAFVQDANDRLYSRRGLSAARRALLPGGVLAVWSAYADARFGSELADAGFAVSETVVPAYAGSRNDMHTLWFARRPHGSAEDVAASPPR